jgi:hypothetical protein
MWEPPNPRLITGSGAMSSDSVVHIRMLEEPTNSTLQAAGGDA